MTYCQTEFQKNATIATTVISVTTVITVTTVTTDTTVTTVTTHLCFKQAQPKMCHSPKVDNGVEV